MWLPRYKNYEDEASVKEDYFYGIEYAAVGMMILLAVFFILVVYGLHSLKLNHIVEPYHLPDFFQT